MSIAEDEDSNDYFSSVESLAEEEDSDYDRHQRMEMRKQSPKIKRRKKRSTKALLLAELEAPSGLPSKQDLLVQTTQHLENATNKFLDTVERILAEDGNVLYLYNNPNHPLLVDMKEAIENAHSLLLSLAVEEQPLLPLPSDAFEEDETLHAFTKSFLLTFLSFPNLDQAVLEEAVGALAELVEREAHYFWTCDHALALIHVCLKCNQPQMGTALRTLVGSSLRREILISSGEVRDRALVVGGSLGELCNNSEG